MSTRWTKTAVKCVDFDDGVTHWSAQATTGDDFHTSHVDLILGVKRWFLNGIEQNETLDWPDMKSVEGPRHAMILAKQLSVEGFERQRAEGWQ